MQALDTEALVAAEGKGPTASASMAYAEASALYTGAVRASTPLSASPQLVDKYAKVSVSATPAVGVTENVPP